MPSGYRKEKLGERKDKNAPRRAQRRESEFTEENKTEYKEREIKEELFVNHRLYFIK